MPVPAFLDKISKKIFRSPFSDQLIELLEELQKNTLAPLTDDELSNAKFRIEADVESIKYRGIFLGTIPVVATIFTLLINTFSIGWKYFMIIAFTIFFIGMIEIFGNFIHVHRDATYFLKVIDDEIEKRSKEKEEYAKTLEKLSLDKQALVEKREKLLNQKYRK